MPSAVVDTINRYRTALLAREQATMADAARRWLGVEQAIQAQVDALAYELANTTTPTFGQLSRSARYRALRQQLNAELAKYVNETEDVITRGQRDMITRAISHSATAINTVATEAQIIVPFNQLPTEAVANMIGLAGDGSPLRAVLNEATRGAGDALGQQLVNGIALGRNPLAVARAAIRLGLGQSFTRLQNIARTEQLRVYRETTLRSYQASGAVIAYRRLSARDTRVCPACLFADGRIYRLDEGFDEHPQGRCTMVPVLAGVPPAQFETGQQWFRSQPTATQRQMLGKGRFEAWQDGRASLDDLVSRDWNDTWGGALRTTNVRDLNP